MSLGGAAPGAQAEPKGEGQGCGKENRNQRKYRLNPEILHVGPELDRHAGREIGDHEDDPEFSEGAHPAQRQGGGQAALGDRQGNAEKHPKWAVAKRAGDLFKLQRDFDQSGAGGDD